MDHANPPAGELPAFLHGLRFPATPDEASLHAQAHGAEAQDLAFLESLPAAVFTSEEGVRHAFSEMRGHAPEEEFRTTTAAHDGTSS